MNPATLHKVQLVLCSFCITSSTWAVRIKHVVRKLDYMAAPYTHKRVAHLAVKLSKLDSDQSSWYFPAQHQHRVRSKCSCTHLCSHWCVGIEQAHPYHFSRLLHLVRLWWISATASLEPKPPTWVSQTHNGSSSFLCVEKHSSLTLLLWDLCDRNMYSSTTQHFMCEFCWCAVQKERFNEVESDWIWSKDLKHYC